MKNLHWMMLAVLAAVLAPTAVSAAGGPALAVAAVQAPGSIARETSVDAVVEAVRQTTLSTQVPGAIVALRVKAGDRVRAGQELLRIDARAAQQNVAGSAAQVEAAQAGLNVAARELERQRALFQKQYISQAALDRSLAQWEAAQAQLKALQAQTQAVQTQSSFFVLTAPYAGVVSEVPATLGDMAMPGRPLITLYDPAALRVSAAIPQTLIAGVSANLKALRYEVPGLTGVNGPQPAPQAELLPAVDAATHTAQLRLALPAGATGLAPGMFARVWLPEADAGARDAAQRLFVPAAAVIRRGEVTAVYVLDAQGAPRLRQVRLGRAEAGRVEVLSGLRAEDKVAADAQAAAAAPAATPAAAAR